MKQHLPGGQKRDQLRTQVAVIGTGLAGLTTAYLLQNDIQARYEVTLFEQAQTLSFDSASVSVRDKTTGLVDRIDLPMRGSVGGYYTNLMRMYEYLGIRLHPLRLFFAFTEVQSTSSTKPLSVRSQTNTYQIQPPRPVNRFIVPRLLETLYIIICYLWFSTACFCVPPRTSKDETKTNKDTSETLSKYLERIRLPRRFVTHYLLPLVSSASTCSHAEAMSFPATDIVNYEKLSHGQKNYTVCGGVHQVQSKLATGIRDIRLGCRVIAIEPVAAQDGAIVRWTLNVTDPAFNQFFDRIVLAVSPIVASRLFSPLLPALSKIPTAQTESSVLSPEIHKTHQILDVEDSHPPGLCSHHDGNYCPPQSITFQTIILESGSITESLHVMPNGVLVSTRPSDPTADLQSALHTATFTRTLRTVESRAVVQNIMRLSPERKCDDAASYKMIDQAASGWVNGQDNVWLVGAWCWDGLVLLEGCVVSAMRVADDFGVEIPWRLDSVPYARCQRAKAFVLGFGKTALAVRRQLSVIAWAVVTATAATTALDAASSKT